MLTNYNKMANMFGGKDAANPSYPTQWALNPNAYQNIDCSNVDWAALAQQWIAMKEAAAIVDAVPPTSKPDVEEGEAPMEVENPDIGNNETNELQPVADQWNAAGNPWTTNNWSQWGWGWPAGDAKGMDPTMGNMAMPMMDGFSVPNDSSAPMAGYGSGPGPTFQHGYWTAPQAEQATSPSSRGGSSSRRSKSKNRDSKSSSSRSHRSNRSTTNREKVPVLPPVMEPVAIPSATLDAAKRRQLPAWIREGLEKMEREKQKAIEREEEKKARELAEAEKKKFEEEELARMKAEASGEPMLPPKSKFESESEAEESDKELPADDEPSEEAPVPDAPSPPQLREPSPPPLVRKSKEEIMQEVMLAVRRSLTEILLEVTDQEIHTISQEELTRYTTAQASRLNAMRASNSKALASIASGLGLGAYESSSEESDGDDEPRDITDHQLQELIKRKRSEFEQTSREIEAEVRRAELREAGLDPDAVVDSTPERRSRSSVTPPLVESDTPKKIPERRLSDKKNNHHKSADKVDGTRKLDPIPEEKFRREHTPSPPRENHKHKETSSTSSDSENDSSSTESDSSASVEEVKVEKRSKKRKRKSSSDSERRKSKKQKKDKSRKSERSRQDERKSSRRDEERSHKSSRSRDVRERSHKDKYRDDSEERRRSKRSKRSRSPSYESRRKSRTRDASEEYRTRRRERSHERSRSDRYERSRDYDRRRSRSRSRSRSRHRR